MHASASTSPTRSVTLARRRLRSLHDHPRQHRCSTSPCRPSSRTSTSASRAWPGRLRLRARLRRPAPDRRAPGRHLRPPPALLDRPGGFTVASLLAGLAPEREPAHRRARAAGRRRRDDAPPTLAIISHTFPDERERATAIGIWAATSAAAFAVGPVIGGLITEHIHWTWIFFVNLPSASSGSSWAAFIPESRDPDADRHWTSPACR